MTSEMRIIEADRLDCRLVEHRWRYAEETGAEMDRLWAGLVQQNPALYDGKVLLACRAEERIAPDGARVLEMDFFETRFSRFHCWREFGWADPGVFNSFAMPAVRSSDGAWLLGEMGPGHSSAGQIYFPGGTPDLLDVTADGRVDLDGSLVRELAEEAGLDAARGRPERGWTIVFDDQRIACVKRLDWDGTAEALRAEVRAFIARETNPELCDAHFLSRREELDDPRLPRFMVGYLAHLFARARESGAEE